MYGEQGVKAVHKNACLVKIWGKGYSFSLVQRLLVKCITLLQDIHVKYWMVPVPGCTIRHNKLIQFQFVLMLVCFTAKKLCHRLVRSTYKFYFLFSNLCFRNVMSCLSAIWLTHVDGAMDPISVAFFNQVTFFFWYYGNCLF